MTGPQIGGYAPGEIEYLLEHDNTVLLEVAKVGYKLDKNMEPGGAGLGREKNLYHKVKGPPKGTWSIDRSMLARADKGELFMDLLNGSAYILTEYAAPAAASLTTGETLVSVLQVREITAGTVWVEGTDYTVNYATHVVTFVSTVPAGGVEVKYISSQAELVSANKITNGGFEDALTNIWTYMRAGGDVATTVAQDAAGKDVGTYAMKVDTTTTQHSGAKYTPAIVVIPGRVHRFRFRIKGTATETFKGQWTDGAGTVDMTPVGGAGTLSGAAYNTFEYTFTPDESTITDIRIINTTAAPHAFYLDEVYLGLNSAETDPLDGQRHPFVFNIIGRRVVDGVTVFKLKKAAIYGLNRDSGSPYTEKLDGQFLDYDGEP